MGTAIVAATPRAATFKGLELQPRAHDRSQRGRSQRQPEVEGASLPFLALHPDPAPVSLDGELALSKAVAGAAHPRLQMRQLQRIHHDFEEANRRLLDKSTVDKSKLARPFSGFIKEKAS